MIISFFMRFCERDGGYYQGRTSHKQRKEKNMTLGKTIKMARVYKNYSAQDVAMKTGIAVSTYSNIEKGITKNPELTTLKKISDVLGLDLMELLNLVG